MNAKVFVRKAARRLRRALAAEAPAASWDGPPHAAAGSNVLTDGLIICNFCATVFKRTGGNHSEFLACPHCGTIARERIMYHCLLSEQQRRTGVGRPFIAGNADLRNRTVLECSPRRNANRRAIYEEVCGRYLASDFDLSHHRADLKLDLTREEDVAPHRDAFDIILCTGVLEHVPDYVGALGNLRRMLKPDGYVVFQVPLLERSYTRVTWDEFHEDDTRVFHRFGFDLLDVLDRTFPSVTPVVGLLDYEITSPEVSKEKYLHLRPMAGRCQIIGAETMNASGLGNPELCDAFILRR